MYFCSDLLSKVCRYKYFYTEDIIWIFQDNFLFDFKMYKLNKLGKTVFLKNDKKFVDLKKKLFFQDIFSWQTIYTLKIFQIKSCKNSWSAAETSIIEFSLYNETMCSSVFLSSHGQFFYFLYQLIQNHYWSVLQLQVSK